MQIGAKNPHHNPNSKNGFDDGEESNEYMTDESSISDFEDGEDQKMKDYDLFKEKVHKF